MSPAKIRLFIFSLLLHLEGSAQILPVENSTLNYTTVYFEGSLQPRASHYELLVYRDSLAASSDQPFLELKNEIPAFWARGLAWGATYVWKIKAYTGTEKELPGARKHTFHIAAIQLGHLSHARFEIKTNKAPLHAGGLLLVDYTRCIYDRIGRAVWTLPDIPQIVDGRTQIRDLKITGDNTITFLTEKQALEIDLDAQVIWKAPFPFVLGKDTIQYHHDLKKTARGTYLVLGNKKIARSLPGNYTEASLQNESEVWMSGGTAYKKTQMTVLLEFNRQGELIWYWDADSYITNEDLAYKKSPSGFPVFSTHSNAFSENEEGTKIYIGFRDLSRIIKIDKATKQVESSYGEKYPSGEARFANDAFRRQHDATITKRNSLLIFNNNNPPEKPGKQVASGIVELSERTMASDSVPLWYFELDTLAPNWSAGGGNVVELPNTNLLVCAGQLNRILEVTRSKEIVWDAMVTSQSKNDTAWKPFPQYRCSWTAALKAYHFIPYLVSVTRSRTGGLNIDLGIVNTGNAGDSYKVEVLAGADRPVHKEQSKLLQPDEKLELHLNTPALLPAAKNIRIRISSEKGMLTKQLDTGF